MLTKKSFQARIEDASKVFMATVEKLRSVRDEMTEQIGTNEVEIERLKQENSEISLLQAKTERQIDTIGQFLI